MLYLALNRFLIICEYCILVADKAERLVAETAGYGSQLVVFPEAFVGGYPRGSDFGVSVGSRTAKGREEFRKYHSAAIDVPGKSLIQLRVAVTICLEQNL